MSMVMDGVLFDASAAAKRGRIAARHVGEAGEFSRTNIAFYDAHVESYERTPGVDRKFTDDAIQTSADLDLPMFCLPAR